VGVASPRTAYVGGCTTSPKFPTAFPFQATLGNSPPFACCEDAFVAKLAASGSALVYSSYLGGSGRDEVHGLAVDGNGRAIVAGLTQSADFPTTANVSQAALRGASGQDAFVTSVQADGQTLRFSTFLGSSGTDEANAVAVGPDGHLVVAGMAGSSDFPSSGGAAAQPASGGGIDGFVVKMDNVNSLSKILDATYLGGGGMDWADAVATDSAGNVYVALRHHVRESATRTRGPVRAARLGGGLRVETADRGRSMSPTWARTRRPTSGSPTRSRAGRPC